MPKEMKLIFGPINPPTYAFIMDIESKLKKGIPLSDLQETYISIIQKISLLSNESISLLSRKHDWFFVFNLINEFANALIDNIKGYKVIDHNDNLRFLVTIYNCCADVHPWRPKKNRFLNWLFIASGWEEEIRQLVYEHPLKEHLVRLKLDEIMFEIERLVTFVNDLKFVGYR